MLAFPGLVRRIKRYFKHEIFKDGNEKLLEPSPEIVVRFSAHHFNTKTEAVDASFGHDVPTSRLW